MTKTYAEREKERQAGLIQAKDEVFYGAEDGGLYDGKKSHEYILKRCEVQLLRSDPDRSL